MKYSPFLLLYNRELKLPIDFKYDMVDFKSKQNDESFYKSFDVALPTGISIREKVNQTVGENILHPKA